MAQYAGLIKCKAGCTCSKHTPPAYRPKLPEIVINRARQKQRGNVHSRQCPNCNANIAAGEKHTKLCIFRD